MKLSHFQSTEPLPAQETASGNDDDVPCPAPADQPQATRIPISWLRPGESPRLEGQSEAHINRLAEIDDRLPPILVDRRTMTVIDGMHRLMAASLKGMDSIEVVFYEGSPADAFLHAVQANVKHGFPLTQVDRRAAAARIIESHPQLSDRAIAHMAGLGAKTVASIRLQASDRLPQSDARVGRDGRIRPLNAAEGRLKAAELLAQRPHASLREVARAAGVSPATVSDVRKRMERGDVPTTEQAEKARSVAPVVPSAVLEKLARDPSVRLKEEGRRLLRLLQQGAVGTAKWTDLIEAVPPHCTDLVRELASYYAQTWSAIVKELDDRSGQ